MGIPIELIPYTNYFEKTVFMSKPSSSLMAFHSCSFPQHHKFILCTVNHSIYLARFFCYHGSHLHCYLDTTGRSYIAVFQSTGLSLLPRIFMRKTCILCFSQHPNLERNIWDYWYILKRRRTLFMRPRRYLKLKLTRINNNTWRRRGRNVLMRFVLE